MAVLSLLSPPPIPPSPHRRLASGPLHHLLRRRCQPGAVLVRSSLGDRVAIAEAPEEFDRYVWNGNGGVLGRREVVVVESGSSNGALVKYSGGNGAATVVVGEVVVDEGSVESKRKKRVEEIGKEDAWFKKGGEQQPEVSKF